MASSQRAAESVPRTAAPQATKTRKEETMLTLVTRDLAVQQRSRQLVADVAALHEMQARRPLRPPGRPQLEPAPTTAGSRDAAAAAARDPRVELEHDTFTWNQEDHEC